mmetsp:Transcript_40856/g.108007  ORF Transcript_40856/g.108007 Transcript_40856/m.108007 type:complete len:233 (-) Transcript_40856:1628-2326(-)
MDTNVASAAGGGGRTSLQLPAAMLREGATSASASGVGSPVTVGDEADSRRTLDDLSPFSAAHGGWQDPTSSAEVTGVATGRSSRATSQEAALDEASRLQAAGSLDTGAAAATQGRQRPNVVEVEPSSPQAEQHRRIKNSRSPSGASHGSLLSPPGSAACGSDVAAGRHGGAASSRSPQNSARPHRSEVEPSSPQAAELFRIKRSGGSGTSSPQQQQQQQQQPQTPACSGRGM